MSIIVLGSINMDFFVQTPRFPAPGETLQGKCFFTTPGGKGANQAVAAARLGSETYFIGRVGNDRIGQELLSSLQENGVNCDRLIADPETPTGTAFITVNDHSENTIIIIPGANGNINHTDLERLKPLLTPNNLLLLQLEIPLEITLSAAQQAHQAGVPVILDPAPAPDYFPPELYPLIDYITPNETEASRLVGFAITDNPSRQQAAEILLNQGVKTVILKLGADGVFCATPTAQYFLQAFPVTAIDTVAAGDAFNGAFASALNQQLNLEAALTWGNAAGALATTQAGAQPSLPSQAALAAFLDSVEWSINP